MKRIKKRLEELTEIVLNGAVDAETFERTTDELKAIRELINTRKAYNAFVDNYGEDDSEEETDASTKQKRVSTAKFD